MKLPVVLDWLLRASSVKVAVLVQLWPGELGAQHGVGEGQGELGAHALVCASVPAGADRSGARRAKGRCRPLTPPEPHPKPRTCVHACHSPLVRAAPALHAPTPPGSPAHVTAVRLEDTAPALVRFHAQLRCIVKPAMTLSLPANPSCGHRVMPVALAAATRWVGFVCSKKAVFKKV